MSLRRTFSVTLDSAQAADLHIMSQRLQTAPQVMIRLALEEYLEKLTKKYREENHELRSWVDYAERAEDPEAYDISDEHTFDPNF